MSDDAPAQPYTFRLSDLPKLDLQVDNWHVAYMGYAMACTLVIENIMEFNKLICFLIYSSR